jgi:NDP-sugar pyrophosphorylase family protein
MIGAILTGGYGKRMQGLSQDMPKNLLQLRDGYTILDRQLRDFKAAGVDEVYMLTGYKGEMIEKMFGERWNGIGLRYLREEKPMGTLWSVRNLFNHVQEDVILRNGDTICDAYIEDIVDFSLSQGKAATVVAVKMRSPYGILSIRGMEVTGFREKPVLNHYINAGTYYLKERVRKYIEMEYEGKDIENTLFSRLADESELSAFKYNGFWRSVDSLKDYEDLRNIYSTRVDHYFGYEQNVNDSHVYHVMRNRKLKVKGSGKMSIVDGHVVLNGKNVKRRGRVEVMDGDELEIVRESVIEFSSSVNIEQLS